VDHSLPVVLNQTTISEPAKFQNEINIIAIVNEDPENPQKQRSRPTVRLQMFALELLLVYISDRGNQSVERPIREAALLAY
jgi:hypothetical protein